MGGFWWEALLLRVTCANFLTCVTTCVCNALPSRCAADQYLYSLYWSVTTLSMVEANSVPSTMLETVRWGAGCCGSLSLGAGGGGRGGAEGRSRAHRTTRLRVASAHTPPHCPSAHRTAVFPPASPRRSCTIRAGLFLFFNTALGSYIVGTITLLVVKADERTGSYRERSANLQQYTQVQSREERCACVWAGGELLCMGKGGDEH